eukprot:1157985-Pelagomonas_calceolata.AAC.2
MVGRCSGRRVSYCTAGMDKVGALHAVCHAAIYTRMAGRCRGRRPLHCTAGMTKVGALHAVCIEVMTICMRTCICSHGIEGEIAFIHCSTRVCVFLLTVSKTCQPNTHTYRTNTQHAQGHIHTERRGREREGGRERKIDR